MYLSTDHYSHHSYQRGSTLIEIMMAVGIMSVVMTAVVAMLANSVRTMALVQARSKASKDAQVGMEFFRQWREQGWDVFSKAAVAAGRAGTPFVSVCLSPTRISPAPLDLAGYNSLSILPTNYDPNCTPQEEITVRRSCAAYGLNNMFGRFARVTYLDDNTLSVRVSVLWDEHGRDACTHLTQIFRKAL